MRRKDAPSDRAIESSCPQRPRGVIGTGTAMADLHLPVRLNGDLALFQAIGALLIEWDALDHDFLAWASPSTTTRWR